MNLNKKSISIIIILLIAVIGGGFWYFNKSAYAQPPSSIVVSDFPAHNINIEKYFTPVEMKWNTEIKVPKRSIKSIMKEGNNISRSGAYMQVYQQMMLGYMYKKVDSKFPKGEVPFKEEFNKCIKDAKNEREEMTKKICRGEKIESESRQQCINKLLEKEKRYDELPWQIKKNIDDFKKGKTTYCDSCHLPVEVTHRLYIKQYVEWEKCTENFIKKLKDNNYL